MAWAFRMAGRIRRWRSRHRWRRRARQRPAACARGRSPRRGRPAGAVALACDLAFVDPVPVADERAFEGLGGLLVTTELHVRVAEMVLDDRRGRRRARGAFE